MSLKYNEHSLRYHMIFQFGEFDLTSSYISGQNIEDSYHQNNIIQNIKSGNYIFNMLLSQNYLSDSLYVNKLKEIFLCCHKESIKQGVFFQGSIFFKTSYIEMIKNTTTTTDLRKEGNIRISVINSKGIIFYDDIDFKKDINETLEHIKRVFLKLINYFKIDFNNKKFEEKAHSVVFSSKAASYLIHEIIGHLLEKDYIDNNTSILSNIKLGDKIFNKNMNVYNDSRKNEIINIGTGNYDDYCNETSKTCIINEGKLINYVQDYRRESYKDSPIVRMSYLYLKENPNTTLDCNKMISRLNDGVYVDDIFSGAVIPSTGQFALICGLSKRIKHGEVIGVSNNICIIDNVNRIIENIIDIGCDFKYYIGSCNKSDQTVSVAMGAPSMQIDNLKIFYGGA